MKYRGLQLHHPPPFLIGAVLLFWGWQCSFLPYAVLMCITIEITRIVPWRWNITDTEFNTLSDFSGVIFFLSVIYIFSDEGAKGIYVILSVLPFILFPLLAVQKYSSAGLMKISALIVSLRKLEPEQAPESGKLIDLAYPYLLICMISASTGNQRNLWFFIFISTLISVILWQIRPRRFRLLMWLGALCISLSIAFATQYGLRRMQASIEASFLSVFDQFMWRFRDPNRTTTAIGSLGRLKLSDKIVLRVKTRDKLKRPLLLKEASYNSFGHGIWTTQNSAFSVIDQNSDGSWTLNQTSPGAESVSIATYMLREKSVIPLPHGSNRIHNVTAIEIEKNTHGTVLMDIREGWINFDVNYAKGQLDEGLPGKADLSMLDYHRDDFTLVAEELGLYQLSETEAIVAIENFFRRNFRYSLDQKQRYPKGKYLKHFLNQTRQGHCEYFATATALLLRSIGIPSRYVVGYSVDEYSALEGQYVARSRHAHSWVIAYVNNQWQVLDTTPSIWASSEQENASDFESLMDLWAWISYTWAQWQTDDLEEEEKSHDYLLWLLIPLIIFLAWRLYAQERVSNAPVDGTGNEGFVTFGLDSGFYTLIEEIEQAGYSKYKGETLKVWLNRISDRIGDKKLTQALSLHYQYRFDPEQAGEPLKSELKRLVDSLLASKKNWLFSNSGRQTTPI